MVRKRFPAVPTVAVILKIAAVIFLIVGTIMLAREIMTAAKSQMSGFKWTTDILLNVISVWFEKSLFPAGFAWVAAELMLGVRDMEYNTRRALLGNAPLADTATSAPVAADAPGSETGAPDVPSAPPAPDDKENPGKRPA